MGVAALVSVCTCSLFELLAGEGLELRRVGDLVLSLVLELFPLVLQVSRDSTTSFGASFGSPEGLRILLEPGQVPLTGLRVGVLPYSKTGLKAGLSGEDLECGAGRR